MDIYITEAIDKLSEGMTKTTKMPAGNHLFKVYNACENLCEKEKIIFHRLVAKFLFLRNLTRPDIQPTNVFLTTRVINTEK